MSGRITHRGASRALWVSPIVTRGPVADGFARGPNAQSQTEPRTKDTSMVEGDIFREVEEEMRRERMAALWDKYGVYVIGAAVAVIVGVAGYQGYQYFAARSAQQASLAYEDAAQLITQDKTQEAIDAFRTLADDAPAGYATLARLRSASLHLANDDKEAALTAYEAVAQDRSAEDALRTLARMRAAIIKLDLGRTDELTTDLAPLAVAGNPWRHTARELLAVAALEDGRTADAEGYYNEIFSDAETPASLRQRAQDGLQLIVSIDARKAGEEAGDNVGEEAEAQGDGAGDPAPGEPEAPDADADANDGDTPQAGAPETDDAGPETAGAEAAADGTAGVAPDDDGASAADGDAATQTDTEAAVGGSLAGQSEPASAPEEPQAGEVSTTSEADADAASADSADTEADAASGDTEADAAPAQPAPDQEADGQEPDDSASATPAQASENSAPDDGTAPAQSRDTDG